MQTKQIKFPLFVTNEPQKMVAICIFALTFFLFIGELIIAFQFNEKKQMVMPKTNFVPTQADLRKDSPLFKTSLFGDYVPTNLADADIKQSMLDAEVVGVMFATKEEESQVIIRAGGGGQKTYVVGDVLPGGAIIKRITEKGVVVLHKGVLESLSLPKNELIFEAPAKPLIEE
ncbi:MULTISPECIES: type II secretion system protein N [unclassified Legionella]|uniref:type II secretion system protein N n=1 Tax=unclassified Legionella TaxID=2622702 RepID=UPI001E3E0703|nr:type II secretion system protein N [Legionella sp. 31fI33]MCC5015734.1 general secretion pathway protein GspC [Legionella sp. 31fI33]